MEKIKAGELNFEEDKEVFGSLKFEKGETKVTEVTEVTKVTEDKVIDDETRKLAEKLALPKLVETDPIVEKE